MLLLVVLRRLLAQWKVNDWNSASMLSQMTIHRTGMQLELLMRYDELKRQVYNKTRMEVQILKVM